MYNTNAVIFLCMDISWNTKEPIYLQLHDRLVELILDGVFQEGNALPSVRQISSEQRINPITVSKAIQLLVDGGLVEKRRGLGMFVLAGAKEKLIHEEKTRFLEEEWPQIAARIERLGIALDDLLGFEATGSRKDDGVD